MKFSDYKLIFCAVGLIGTLFIASPLFENYLIARNMEPYSELYMLGPQKMTENYPFNIDVGRDYLIYLGVQNQMGESQYYTLFVKFRNETDRLPNTLTNTPSSLPVLFEYKFVLQNGQNWEVPFNFSFSEVQISSNQSIVNILSINGTIFQVNKPAFFNSTGQLFFYQLLFELWIYDEQSESLKFDNRYVALRLNCTESINPSIY